MRLLISFLLIISVHSVAQPNLTVVTELSPPNQMLLNNQVTGHSTQLVKMILSQAQLDAAISMYPWARAYKMASHNSNTLIYSMARTPEREALFHWIGPVAQFNMGFVKLTERTDINVESTDQAKQYKIAAQRHDLASDILKKRGFELIQTTDIQKSYQLLLAKKVDLVIDDANYIAAMSEQLATNANALTFVHAIEGLTVEGYLAANINTDEKVVAELQQAFLKIKHTPQYQQLMNSN
ncbi:MULTISPECIES: substrate-binding periplasmic protein [Pseudoalteromonas]|uniref:Transporter substrate-binding domain-containing protein n=1 Tax=Pseudoalteromonas haloplanktis TaxID=228 RepID=A0ABU1B6N7_PSEHA|nr:MULTISPECIES: transporter substrate-binding domain-containing protein [Pseudoalteromonas]MCF6146268.1 polar amino acid transport system substrate-binding protein [Pseudoalteromonas mariniglutinosa NCIMB 1770]MDQ9090228.1 transporter substrate-binding domain-containing protein [Pseudoalteromonas haloplanktis]TMN71936.1 amino acid ABC transporter substrate-binding protein [Pseudoalteromonas sp. S1727]